MITLFKYGINEICDEFPDICKSVFGEFTYEGNCPSEVYLGYEEECFLGFISGYIVSPNTWYLQRAGFKIGKQGNVGNLRKYLEALSKIHEEYGFILTRVINTDIKPLKMDIMAGFIIIGIRQDTSGKLWVELIHKKEN